MLLRAIDLFSGAGGLSLGFELAGFKVCAAVDADPIAAETYRQNNPDVPLLVEKIEEISGKALLALAGGPVDVVVGGPSCQGFSTHGKRNPYDSRNFLFQHFVRLVGEVRPTWVVMENVKGLLTYDKGRYREEIHASFRKIGYNIDSRVLRAADYGVPQLRERVFFIATRTDQEITFPTATHCPPDLALLTGLAPYVTVEDAIGDLPRIGAEGEERSYASPPRSTFQEFARRGHRHVLTLHRAKRVSATALSLITRIPPGRGIRAIPHQDLPERFRIMRTISNGQLRQDCTTLYHRLRWDRPSHTITCYFTNVSSGPFVHPSENRALTPREAARLQSFPDSFLFFPKQLQKQIGNAVPPLLAAAVANEVSQKIASLRRPRRRASTPRA